MTLNTTAEQPLDFLAIGLGPHNLSLACMTEPLHEVRCLFLEKRPEFAWHADLLIDGTTLQNPFLADLVSMADPTSPYSYLNYCKKQGRLYNYYIRENFYLSRKEYDAYCKWASQQLSNIRFSHDVREIWYDEAGELYVVSGLDIQSQRSFQFKARKLVIGIGNSPYIPALCKIDNSGRLIHSSQYLRNKQKLQAGKSITLVGSGQSGAEIYYDLLQDIGKYDYQLNWVTRSPRFFQMETAKLTLEIITPEYIDHFFSLEESVKQRVIHNQKSIYNGINQHLINQIYEYLDEYRDVVQAKTRLLANLSLSQCTFSQERQAFDLQFEHREVDACYQHSTDSLILATGYEYQVPDFIEGIRDRLRWDEQGRYDQARNYSVDHAGNQVFIQNAGFHSHGLTNPDLGLACHQNGYLLREITGHEYYPLEDKTTFQDFLPPADSAFVRLEQRERA
ncbi:lysine N(6)-hydroxylase/L-ornithine N(5)-oxygenase family protein [Azomonas macrocytogenes]|uniref:Lysine N6-hydroxylase n=1 Tax=Azomonas macrocytogenes TaxID=69962 RepID=A0A839T1T7_AZOMA|nr:SidA/IucD/PvdA family monooxygenase [Azomonas macrocytogenes]MBB3103068.1 lysine N6-hydroxylase [Azomonas macrocytogenes]